MVQLDSALQVDPLFHKMSKAFDEGGAKGLLLANLGVSTTGAEGCQIVFDSSCNEDDDTNNNSNNNNNHKDEQVVEDENGVMVDMEWFTQTLPSISSLPPLVPQLQALRAEYELLKSQGFVEDDNNEGRAAGRKSTSDGGANGNKRRRSKV
jgi:condensin complex subunit 2